ncbi:MAG: hypothetical protein H7A45_21015 [Verrucomicrobiales bacterium]|nr:hypothetical protein [Verrucomicrobiales bacterium]
MKTNFLSPTGVTLIAGLTLSIAGCSSGRDEPPPPMTRVIEAPAPPAPPVAVVPVAEPPPAGPDQAPPVVQAEQPILSPGVAEVIDLAQSRVGDSVLIDYVSVSSVPYRLAAEEIVYLKDVGISDEVIAAMIRRGQELGVGEVAEGPDAVAIGDEAAPGGEILVQTVAAAPEAPVYTTPVSTSAVVTLPPAGEATVTPPATVTNNYFYGALSPYGSWVSVADYGWCWQPTCAVVDTGWRPYCHNGRWVHSSAGWYWQSYYSWGWAPFHYGRWHLSPARGWVWVPGHVWGPAWVTWRYTDAFCGWAPLPPSCGWSTGIGLTFHGSGVSVGFGFGLGSSCYTFTSYRNFCDPHPYRHRPPAHETTAIYQNSTVINNVIVGDNNTIINRGIAPERVPAVARGEVPRMELRDVNPGRTGGPRPNQAVPGRNELAVYRPKVPPQLTAPARGNSGYEPPYHALERQATWAQPAPSRMTATRSSPSDSSVRAPGYLPARRSLGSVSSVPARSGPTAELQPGVTQTPSRSLVSGPSPSSGRSAVGSVPARGVTAPSRSALGGSTRSTPGTSTFTRPIQPSAPARAPVRITPSAPSRSRTITAPSSTPSRGGTLQPAAPARTTTPGLSAPSSPTPTRIAPTPAPRSSGSLSVPTRTVPALTPAPSSRFTAPMQPSGTRPASPAYVPQPRTPTVNRFTPAPSAPTRSTVAPTQMQSPFRSSPTPVTPPIQRSTPRMSSPPATVPGFGTRQAPTIQRSFTPSAPTRSVAPPAPRMSVPAVAPRAPAPTPRVSVPSRTAPTAPSARPASGRNDR